MSKLTRQSCFSSHHWPEPSKLLKPQQNSICATGLTEKTLWALPTLQSCVQTIGKDLAVTIISHPIHVRGRKGGLDFSFVPKCLHDFRVKQLKFWSTLERCEWPAIVTSLPKDVSIAGSLTDWHKVGRRVWADLCLSRAGGEKRWYSRAHTCL